MLKHKKSDCSHVSFMQISSGSQYSSYIVFYYLLVYIGSYSYVSEILIPWKLTTGKSPIWYLDLLQLHSHIELEDELVSHHESHPSTTHMCIPPTHHLTDHVLELKDEPAGRPHHQRAPNPPQPTPWNPPLDPKPLKLESSPTSGSQSVVRENVEMGRDDDGETSKWAVGCHSSQSTVQNIRSSLTKVAWPHSLDHIESLANGLMTSFFYVFS